MFANLSLFLLQAVEVGNKGAVFAGFVMGVLVAFLAYKGYKMYTKKPADYGNGTRGDRKDDNGSSDFLVK